MGNQVNNDEITLKELVTTSKSWYTYLLHRWKIIIIFSLLGGMCGLCLAFVSKPVYTASLTFIVEDQPSGEMNGALGMANMLGFDIGNSGSGIFTGANLIELFKSRNMVQKALLSPVPANGQLISFAEMYIRFFKLREIWAKNTTLQSIQFLPNADATQFSRSQDSILISGKNIRNSNRF